jgi:uncharacterized membrane protein YfcA
VEIAKSTDTIFLFSKEWAVSNIWISQLYPNLCYSQYGLWIKHLSYIVS